MKQEADLSDKSANEMSPWAICDSQRGRQRWSKKSHN